MTAETANKEKSFFSPEAVPELEPLRLDIRDWRDGIAVRVPNWLGDAAMCIPALWQLNRSIPEDCGLFVVVPGNIQDLFEALGFIDRLVVLEESHRAWTARELAELRKLRPGIGLFFNNSFRDALYFRLAGIPRLYGAAARCRGILLTHAWNTHSKMKPRRDNPPHHAAKYLAYAQALGAPEWDGSMPEFRDPVDYECLSRDVLFPLENEERRILAVAPGAAYGPAKMWSAENYRDICETWARKGWKIAIFGTDAEKPVAAQITESLPPADTVDLTGKTSLGELIWALKKCDMCLSNDSGIMHLAAILGLPGVAVFASTDPMATGPISEKWTVLRKRQECAPCFNRVCNHGHYRCLNSIRPAEVTAEMEKLRAIEDV